MQWPHPTEAAWVVGQRAVPLTSSATFAETAQPSISQVAQVFHLVRHVYCYPVAAGNRVQPAGCRLRSRHAHAQRVAGSACRPGLLILHGGPTAFLAVSLPPPSKKCGHKQGRRGETRSRNGGDRTRCCRRAQKARPIRLLSIFALHEADRAPRCGPLRQQVPLVPPPTG